MELVLRRRNVKSKEDAMTDLTATQAKVFVGSLFVVPGFLDWIAEKVVWVADKFVSIVCPMVFICA